MAESENPTTANSSDKTHRIFLAAAAAGLTPIALSYGAVPLDSIPYLFGIPIEGVNAPHIFRAVMGLYLGQALFWVAGVVKPELTRPALWSAVIFMWGLAFGRCLSFVLDGVPDVLLSIYLLLEILFGTIGVLLLRK